MVARIKTIYSKGFISSEINAHNKDILPIIKRSTIITTS
jgi:hypothetical protein